MAEKVAILEEEAAAVEVMDGVEGEVMAAVEEAVMVVAAVAEAGVMTEVLIAGTIEAKTEIEDLHPSRKGRKSMLPSTLLENGATG